MPGSYSLSPLKALEPGRLFVLAFPDELSAFSLRELLCEMEEEGAIEVGDAVVATRNAGGKVRLHQSLPLVSAGAAVGSFGGMILGMMLLNPLFGSVAGAALGAAAGSLRDTGIDDAFMKNLAASLTPGTSALFVLVRNSKPDRVLEHLQPFAGRCRILQCSMPAENEALLRNLLEGKTEPPHPASSTFTDSKP